MPEYEVFIEGKPRKISLTRTGEKSFTLNLEDRSLCAELESNGQDLKKLFSVKIGTKTYQIELPKIDHERPFKMKVENITFETEIRIPAKKILLSYTPTAPSKAGKIPMQREVSEGAITAPMTGKVVSIKVSKGDQVKAGSILCVIEAMKMENEITSPKAGSVKEVSVSQGSSVSEGQVLFVVG